MSRAVRLDDAQRAAVELEGRDLLVTAGAGTGKTTVLIERVLRKLRTGASSLDRLLLVTFTEKAAREMGERLREVLVEDPTLRPHLAQLGRASISTIHGFCARLLREHFLEAEIDPAFRILDERGQKEAMDDALRRVFHDAYRAKEDGRRFRSLVDMAGFDQDGEVLRKFVIALHETSVSSEDPEQFLRRLEEGAVPASAVELSWWPRFVDWIYEECRESAALLTEAYAIAEATGGKLDPHHRVAGRLSAITRDDLATPAAQAMLISALEAEGWLQASARGKSLDLPRAVKGAKELPGYAELVDTAKSIWKDPILKHLPVDEAKLLRDEETQRDSLRVLARLTRELSHRYGEWKSRFGLLDYSDLEVRTLALLRRHGDALAIRDRYDEVMIDEYQDVNQLQEAILERVSRAGRRFRVGDVKQSIYEFRQADPTLFRRHAESSLRFDPAAPLPAGSAPMAVFLRRNHRSRPPILTAINALFSRLFDARTIGTEYAAQALEPPDSGGDSAADVLDRPVELHLLLPPPRERNEEAKSEEGEGEEAAPGETGPEREARFIARNLRRWLEEANRRREGKDVLSYRDVAILLRTTSHAQDYQAALTAEAIPSALHDAESLLDSRPVQDLRALLRVVDNPRNDIALAAVLRSPIVEFSDSDLTRIRLAWPEAVSYLDALVAVAYGEKLAAEARAFLPPSAEGGAAPWIGRPATLASRLGPDLVRRAREFLDRVQAWRAGSEELPLARFMVHLLEATDLRARLLAMGEAPSEWVLIERMLELAREYEADRGPWLRGFLARLDALESSGGIKGPRPGGVDDAVLLLTVHRSKGLQFPLVILPRLAWQFRDDHQLGSRMRIGRTEAGIRALDWEHWSRRDTLLRSLLAQEAKRAGREEEARVLYVAMTRAQERLVLLAAARKTPVLDHDVPRPLAARRVLAAGDALTWILDALPWQSAESGEDGSLRFEREAWWVFPHAPSAEEAKVAPPDDLAPAPSLRSALEVALAKTRATERPSAALAQAGIRGKYWVTEFKRQEDFARRDAIASDDGAALWLPAAADAEAGANLGTRFHGALQRIDLARSSEAELDAQFAAIAEEPWWDGAERATALEQGFQRFLASPLGRRLVEASADRRVEREVAFSLRWPVRRLAARRDELRAWLEAEGSRLGSSLDEAWVLLQGRIDCVFREGDRHVVIDWKTDRVRRETLDARVEAYRVQMELYREAVSALWGASVESWLVFLALGESIEIGAST